MNKTIFKVECLKAISIHNHININNSNLCCALKRFTIVKWDKNEHTDGGEWKIGIQGLMSYRQSP